MASGSLAPQNATIQIFLDPCVGSEGQASQRAINGCTKAKHPDILQIYKSLCREINKEAIQARERSYAHFIEELADEPKAELQRAFSLCLKAEKDRLRRNIPSTRRIEPHEFTHSIASQFDDVGGIDNGPHYFNLDYGWKKDVDRAITQAPMVKATGANNTFSESLQVVPELAAAALAELWHACGQPVYIPTDWKKVTIFPLYRKNDATRQLQTYCPTFSYDNGGVIGNLLVPTQKILLLTKTMWFSKQQKRLNGTIARTQGKPSWEEDSGSVGPQFGLPVRTEIQTNRTRAG